MDKLLSFYYMVANFSATAEEITHSMLKMTKVIEKIAVAANEGAEGNHFVNGRKLWQSQLSWITISYINICPTAIL